MEKHIDIVGGLHIAFGILGLLAGALIFIVVSGGGLLSGDPTAILVTSTVAGGIAIFLVILSLPGIIGGIGLLKRKNWARVLVIILAFFNFLNFPLGTALSAYTLWVLLSEEVSMRLR